MAKKKQAQDPRRAEQRKAYRLRTKIREGTQLDAEELAWLAAYELTVKKPGAADAPAPAPGELEIGDDDPGGEVDAAGLDPAGELAPEVTPIAGEVTPIAPPAPAELPELPPLGKVPPPPRVAARDKAPEPAGKGAAAGRWQDKHKSAAMGREATCTTIADAWVGVLGAMAEQIKAVGVSPLIDPTSLYGAIVLTVDDLLPAHVEVKPMHVAVLGTSAILGQRFMARKQIAAGIKLAKDRSSAADVRAAAAAEAAAPPPPPPEPASSPSSAAVEPVALVTEPAPSPAPPSSATVNGRIRMVGAETIDLSAPGTVL